MDVIRQGLEQAKSAMMVFLPADPARHDQIAGVGVPVAVQRPKVRAVLQDKRRVFVAGPFLGGVSKRNDMLLGAYRHDAAV